MYEKKLIGDLIVSRIDEASMWVAGGDIHAHSFAAKPEKEEAAGDTMDDDVEGVG